ncbi:MAG: hypothetical protein K9L85_02750 [Candidatus Peribacteraceae bacterium]|nr:hypothetical protein [Candidatus Peribacteraceae bacterium]
MFKKIKNIVSNQADKIIRDPVHASRVVVSSVLILGIFSLTLNLGAQVAPELLGADSTRAEQVSIPTKKAVAEYQSEADKAVLELADKCMTSRGKDTPEWKEFMNNFEKSMSGILPGAGNLILNNPGIVSDRKKQLVVEVMKKYSNLKFCIPEETFETLEQENYKKLSQHLGPFFQVRLREDDTSGEYPANEVHPVFISNFSNELYYAEKDILDTSIFVTDIIDRAIDSAVKLDQQTGDEVALLTSVTSNRLAATTNYALKKVGEVNSDDSNIDASISGILYDIREILAIEHTVGKPVMNGGSWEKPPVSAELKKRIGQAKGHDPVYASNISLEQLGLPSVGDEIYDEIDRLIKGDNQISYGLLNLFSIEDRPVLSKYLGIGMVMYAGSKLGLDPFTPGAEDDVATAANTFTIKVNNPPDDQVCYPLDPSQKDKKCFDFAPQVILLSA